MHFERFIAALQAVNDKNQRQERARNLNNDILCMFETLIQSFQINESDDSEKNLSFLLAFLENILSNGLKNKNNYRYDEAILHFAHSLYILGGRNAYEFVRLNLPGAIPALTILNDSLGKAGIRIEEGEFRFYAPHEHQKSSGYQLAVFSEDCTGVIKKITYNVVTNTFTGFSLPL